MKKTILTTLLMVLVLGASAQCDSFEIYQWYKTHHREIKKQRKEKKRHGRNRHGSALSNEAPNIDERIVGEAKVFQYTHDNISTIMVTGVDSVDDDTVGYVIFKNVFPDNTWDSFKITGTDTTYLHQRDKPQTPATTEIPITEVAALAPSSPQPEPSTVYFFHLKKADPGVPQKGEEPQSVIKRDYLQKNFKKYRPDFKLRERGIYRLFKKNPGIVEIYTIDNIEDPTKTGIYYRGHVPGTKSEASLKLANDTFEECEFVWVGG